MVDDEIISASQARMLMVEMEELLSETIVQVADIQQRAMRLENALVLLPEIKLMLATVTSAQAIMAESAKSMAETFKRGEDRSEKADARYEELTKLALNISNNRIPIDTHIKSTKNNGLVDKLFAGAVAIALLIVVLAYFDYRLTVKQNELEISTASEQQKTRNLIKDKVEEIKQAETK